MQNITKAILAVSEKVTAIEKSMSVGTGGSSYKAVSDSLVRNTLRPEMIKQGLVILPISVEAKTKVDRWEYYSKESMPNVNRFLWFRKSYKCCRERITKIKHNEVFSSYYYTRPTIR